MRRNITALSGIQWDPSRHGVSSVNTVIYELPGHVTCPSAFQAVANVTFKCSDHTRVAPIKMQSDEAFLFTTFALWQDYRGTFRHRSKTICQISRFSPRIAIILKFQTYWKYDCIKWCSLCQSCFCFFDWTDSGWCDLTLNDCSGLTHLTLHLYGKHTSYQYHNPSFIASETCTQCFTALWCLGVCLNHETKLKFGTFTSLPRTLCNTSGNCKLTFSNLFFLTPEGVNATTGLCQIESPNMNSWLTSTWQSKIFCKIILFGMMSLFISAKFCWI